MPAAVNAQAQAMARTIGRFMMLFSWLDAQGSGCAAGVEGCSSFIYSLESPGAATDHFAWPKQVDLAQSRATGGGNR